VERPHPRPGGAVSDKPAKVCSRCKRMTPADGFYATKKKMRDGRMSQCKECHKRATSNSRRKRWKQNGKANSPTAPDGAGWGEGGGGDDEWADA
jgi:hypothetical protein